MRLYPTLCILAISLVGCAASSSDSGSTADSDYTRGRGARDAQPLSGDELRFANYVHVDASTNGWPSHGYAGIDEFVRDASGKRIGLTAALYLEKDRTFTLYYQELEMVDQWNGRALAEKKLTGSWHVEGAVLKLGSAASATTVMTNTGEALGVTLPAGWQASAGLDATLPFEKTSSNVGPNAPFWSDFE
jgi:hypothetical protein